MEIKRATAASRSPGLILLLSIAPNAIVLKTGTRLYLSGRRDRESRDGTATGKPHIRLWTRGQSSEDQS